MAENTIARNINFAKLYTSRLYSHQEASHTFHLIFDAFSNYVHIKFIDLSRGWFPGTNVGRRLSSCHKIWNNSKTCNFLCMTYGDLCVRLGNDSMQPLRCMCDVCWNFTHQWFDGVKLFIRIGAHILVYRMYIIFILFNGFKTCLCKCEATYFSMPFPNA